MRKAHGGACGRKGMRARFPLLAVLLMVPLLPSVPAEDGVACDVFEMPGVGRFCPRADGLLDVVGPTGELLGSTHGPDPVPSEEPGDLATAASLPQPACRETSPADTYYVIAIYARAYNMADTYATRAPQIRSMMAQASAIVDQAASVTGTRAAIEVLCDASGTVYVANVVLPTAKASASFSTIVWDLKGLGWTNSKAKYWIFYDDTGACWCGGMANLMLDDTLQPENRNNGAAISPAMYAVDFGYVDVGIWLHELGHNLGAVQHSAGRSTGAGHCIDGRDIMCYNDGGPAASGYSTSHCATAVFDCGQNDYFNANPPTATSYLATHWNLGSRLNRYIRFEDPFPLSSCSPFPACEGKA